MSNRNFDSRVIIQRLRDQNNAQNLYRYQQSGIQSIRNPLTSDASSERILSYRTGQETTYYKNLIGGGYISSIGGVANILAANVPVIPSPPPPPPPPPIFINNFSLNGGFTSIGQTTYINGQNWSYVANNNPNPPPYNSATVGFKVQVPTNRVIKIVVSGTISRYVTFTDNFLNCNISNLAFFSSYIPRGTDTVNWSYNTQITTNNSGYLLFNFYFASVVAGNITVNNGSYIESV